MLPQKTLITTVVALVAISAFGYGYLRSAPAGEQSPPSPPEKTLGETRIVSRAEVTEHATMEDCWVGYRGEVYDVTAWIPKHPGGERAIASLCGKIEEFEKAFSNQHGSSKDNRLKREATLIGELEALTTE